MQASHGWDGEQGPFFENGFGSVNFADFDRSDYTANALASLFSIKDLCLVDGLEWKQRMLAVRHCIQLLPPPGDTLGRGKRTDLKLITAEKVADWKTVGGRLSVSLVGAGFWFVYALPGGPVRLTADRKRRRQSVTRSYTYQLSEFLLVWMDNLTGETKQVKRPIRHNNW